MTAERIGKYEIIEKIGQGAMGEVHRAHDTVLGRYVAIKTMSAGIGQNDDLRRRFHREAQSAARLNHPNIVTLYDFGEDQGRIFMAMELLEGSDLKDVIRNGSLGLDEKLDLMEQICDGLAAAHDASVVHRDLKPANIHVLPGGKVKIVDFGLARLGTSEMTKTGMVMGTPNYMSPEQVRGERVDARSDVFSMGAVFYELLTNRKAFEADSLHTILFQVLEHVPPPVRHWAPELPEALAPVIERALAKNPAARYQNAGEMCEALRRARQAMIDGGHEEADLLSLLETPRAPASFAASQAPQAGSRQGWVQGTAALEPAPAPSSSPPVAPAGTLSGGSLTQPGMAGGGRTLLIAGGALALIGLIALGVVFLRPREKPAPSPEAGAGVEIVTRQLVMTKIQLAQTKLEVKDYTGAGAEAGQVLELDPGNADAKAILAQVDTTLKELESAANEAREAVKAGNTEKASAALSRVIAIDPQHAVAAELSSQLNSRFQRQADEARQAMKKAQAAAEQAKAGSQQAFTQGVALAREADTLFERSEFTGAAQKYAGARNHFESARRAAQERTAAQPTSAVAAASRPSAGASAPPAGLSPGPTPVAAPVVPPAGGPAMASSAAEEAAVRHVIAEYEKAIEQKDLALFKRIKPNLSRGEEGPLKDGFKLQPKGYDVRITIESVQFNGSEATVRLSRRDMVKSKAMDPTQQTIVLVKSADGWTIRNIGQ